jgi:D-glycero-D-manno-heptose 1,7-bisphosphate phosphatase
MQLIFLNQRTVKEENNGHALFIDRDGTLIRHVDYLHDPDQVVLQPGVREALQLLLAGRYHVFVFTNQSGVGRGYFPIADVFACQERMYELLGISPDQLSGHCIAPEHPSETGGYRKPSPRFINEALEHFNLKRADCHMVGDTCVDLETAWTADIQPWLVMNGKIDSGLLERALGYGKPFHRAASFSVVVNHLLKASDVKA